MLRPRRRQLRVYIQSTGNKSNATHTMSEALSHSPANNKPFPVLAKPFAPEDETALREALKRCSPSTFEAAVQYRKTGNPEHVPAVVIGVIERFVEPDLRVKL